MIATTSTAALATSMIAVVASLTFLVMMLRCRSDPTTRPLIGVAVVLLAGAVLHLLVVDLAPVRTALGIGWEPTESIGGFWMLLAFDMPAIVSGFWFLFALQYTGRDGETSPIAFAVIGVLLVLLVAPNVALAAVGPAFGVPTSALNALLGVTIVLSEALALIGVFLVLATTVGHRAFPAGQPALLALAVGTMLALPFAATTLQRPITTPLAIAASGGLFTVTVHRYRIFDVLPVASVVGRDQVIDEMEEGVVMVDEDGRVRDLNPRAESLLAVDRSSVAGEPIDAVAPSLPDPEAVTGDAREDVTVDSGRTLSITADGVTDDRGRRRGHLFVCRDVTEQRRREHRLGVLTQLLAGATQDEMRDVAEVAADVEAGDRARADGGEHIRETATRIASLVARVRDVERALAERSGDRPGTADLAAIASELDAEAEFGDGDPTADPLPPVAADPELLSATLETLVTGAAAAGETPALRADVDGEAVAVEVEPFEHGPENPVTDISLQVARLAIDSADWSVDPVDRRGDRALRVTLPAASEPVESAAPGGG